MSSTQVNDNQHQCIFLSFLWISRRQLQQQLSSYQHINQLTHGKSILGVLLLNLCTRESPFISKNQFLTNIKYIKPGRFSRKVSSPKNGHCTCLGCSGETTILNLNSLTSRPNRNSLQLLSVFRFLSHIQHLSYMLHCTVFSAEKKKCS